MLKLKCILFNIFLFVPIFCDETVEIPSSSDTLVFAQILFRHGDRNIIHVYKNDPFKDETTYWSDGYGQLTKIGKQQMFELGLYLRRRYFKLLPDNGKYHVNNVYVQSTDTDRTLNSAAYALAAMFPAMNEQIWHKSLMWQAVPIHAVPANMDFMTRPCPRYEQAFNEYTQSAEIQSAQKDNKSFFEYVEKYSGEKVRSFSDLLHVCEPIYIERAQNFTLPYWTDSVLDQMDELAIYGMKMVTNTKQLARLKAGSLIKEIFDRFTMKEDSTLSPNRSIWIYSAHAETIINLLNALDLFEPYGSTYGIPTFASCLFLELHQFNGTFHVELYFKQDRGEDKVQLQPLFIPNCGQKCPLSKLYEIYQDILPNEDFDTECRLPSKLPLQQITKSAGGSTAAVWSNIALPIALIINLWWLLTIP